MLKEVFALGQMLSVSRGGSVIGHSHKFHLGGESRERLMLQSVKEQRSLILARTGDIWSVLWLSQYMVSMCSDTIMECSCFYLCLSWHRVALSDVDIL